MSNVIPGIIGGGLTAWILIERLKSEILGVVKFNEVKIAPQTISGNVVLWSGSVKLAIVLVYGDGDAGISVCVNGECVSGDSQAFDVYTGQVTITASGSGKTPTVKVVYV